MRESSEEEVYIAVLYATGIGDRRHGQAFFSGLRPVGMHGTASSVVRLKVTHIDFEIQSQTSTDPEVGGLQTEDHSCCLEPTLQEGLPWYSTPVQALYVPRGSWHHSHLFDSSHTAPATRAQYASTSIDASPARRSPLIPTARTSGVPS